ncbi:MAG TPA: DUF4112 domain-containing protein [Tepidisphaeraceae bacterium]
MSKPDLQKDLNRARQLAKLLDTQFHVGGIRFGLEGLLGLIPVAGDTMGAVLGLYPLYVARRHRLGNKVQAQMALNLAVEWAGGVVPVVGDLFDIAFKANVRNVKLLEAAANKAGGEIRRHNS